MSIFFDNKIDSKHQIMTSQLMTSFHNLDQKFLNSIFLQRAQQEELKLKTVCSYLKNSRRYDMLNFRETVNPPDKYFQIEVVFSC